MKTLRPNALFGYRNTLRETIGAFDFDTAMAKFSSHILSKEQRDIIDSQFTGEQHMSALASSLGYAKCLMSAEWLFSSLEDSAGTIDLTSISTGYFKALEQFMYAFIGMHTSEKDNKRREIPFMNGKKKNWAHFTDGVYKKQRNSITLVNMARYFTTKRSFLPFPLWSKAPISCRDCATTPISTAVYSTVQFNSSNRVG